MCDAFGLKVDMPRSGGTSTTGNIRRKTFSNPALSSEFLGVDKSLIARIRSILISINCNNSIDPTKFANYCNETTKYS